VLLDPLGYFVFSPECAGATEFNLPWELPFRNHRIKLRSADGDVRKDIFDFDELSHEG